MCNFELLRLHRRAGGTRLKETICLGAASTSDDALHAVARQLCADEDPPLTGAAENQLVQQMRDQARVCSGHPRPRSVCCSIPLNGPAHPLFASFFSSHAVTNRCVYECTNARVNE